MLFIRATAMTGGVLEGLLLAKINQLPNQPPVFTAGSAPEGKTGHDSAAERSDPKGDTIKNLCRTTTVRLLANPW